jgi:hypothetical protein
LSDWLSFESVTSFGCILLSFSWVETTATQPKVRRTIRSIFIRTNLK